MEGLQVAGGETVGAQGTDLLLSVWNGKFVDNQISRGHEENCCFVNGADDDCVNGTVADLESTAY